MKQKPQCAKVGHSPCNTTGRCKHCDMDIEPVECAACGGSGFDDEADDDCKRCNATGVIKWKRIKL